MNDSIAVIRINGIEVGAMPREQYESIKRQVKQDWRTRIASVLSYAGFIWLILIRLWHYFVQSFIIMFAIFMIYSIYNSSEIIQFITLLRNAPTESIANALSTITTISITLSIISCAISFIVKGIPRFVSASENAINKKIREIMEVPAEGKVSITFKKDREYDLR